MQEVKAEGLLHAGIVADDAAESGERALAESVAKAAGVEPQIESGSSEALLHRLEEGEIDLVVGEFAKGSPWKTRVALTVSPVSGSPPASEPVLRAAVRLGENRWLMFVSKTVREEARHEASAG